MTWVFGFLWSHKLCVWLEKQGRLVIRDNVFQSKMTAKIIMNPAKGKQLLMSMISIIMATKIRPRRTQISLEKLLQCIGSHVCSIYLPADQKYLVPYLVTEPIWALPFLPPQTCSLQDNNHEDCPKLYKDIAHSTSSLYLSSELAYRTSNLGRRKVHVTGSWMQIVWWKMERVVCLEWQLLLLVFPEESAKKGKNRVSNRAGASAHKLAQHFFSLPHKLSFQFALSICRTLPIALKSW